MICYESLAYIKEDKDYCIETKVPFEWPDSVQDLDEHKRVAIFACYDPSDPQASLLKGEIALKYLGMYYFDKERSEKACYVSFKKCYDDRLYI